MSTLYDAIFSRWNKSTRPSDRSSSSGGTRVLLTPSTHEATKTTTDGDVGKGSSVATLSAAAQLFLEDLTEFTALSCTKRTFIAVGKRMEYSGLKVQLRAEHSVPPVPG